MIRRIVLQGLAVYVALALLFGLELAGSQFEIGHVYGGFLIAPGGFMVLLVGLFYMRVRSAGSLAKFFALGAMFWLLVLLGIGSLDPMTRPVYPVRYTTYP